MQNKYIFVVLFLCIAFRLLLFGFSHSWSPEVRDNIILNSDPLGYHRLALSILETHHFSYSNTGEPDTIRTPIFPLFLAGIYKIFGNIPWIAILFQIICNTMSCWLIFLIFSRIFSSKIGIIGSLFYALDPLNILFANMLYSDLFFVLFLLISLYFFSVSYTSTSPKITWLGYGASCMALAIASLVRPISQYLIIIYIFFILYNYRGNFTEALKYSLIGLLVFFATLSPWLIRNYLIFNNFALTSVGSHTLLVSVAWMEAAKRNQRVELTEEQLLEEAEEMIIADGLSSENIGQIQQSKYWQRLAMKYIKGNPVEFTKRYFMNVSHIFLNLGTSQYSNLLGFPANKVHIKSNANIIDLIRTFIREKGTFGLFIASIIVPFLLISYLSSMVGLIVSWNRYNGIFLFFCLTIVLYFILISGFIGFARYRLPIIPFYLPFAAIGASYIIEHLRERYSH
jgi:4-amino-4-deoxy-L-arabinose transferase-like glycosyltransferase